VGEQNLRLGLRGKSKDEVSKVQIFGQLPQDLLTVGKTRYIDGFWNPACHHEDPEGDGAIENFE
jgi:hypothetical protein